MEPKEIEDVVKNSKDKPNQILIETRGILLSEFEKTKELIIELTKHLDAVAESYEVINEEIGKRIM